MSAKLKIGFVGAGNMGQCAHLKNYVICPDCEVVALAEIQKERARRVAQRYGIANTYPSHKEMLAAEQLDGIVAAQPFTRHGVLLPELLATGVPVFSEKPIAGAVEVGERIVAAAADGAFLMVGYHKRSDPATMWAKAEIDRLQKTRELGPLQYVRVLMPPGEWIQGGFAEVIPASGEKGTVDWGQAEGLEWDPPAADFDDETRGKYEAFVNYYIHQVNLVRHLLGEPWRVSYADPAGVLLVGHGESGVPCSIEMSPYETTVDWQEQAFICFKHGWIRLDLPAPLASFRAGKVTYYRDLGPGKDGGPRAIEPQLPHVHAMLQQARNFLAAVREEAPPPCGAAEALEDIVFARDYIRMRYAQTSA